MAVGCHIHVLATLSPAEKLPVSIEQVPEGALQTV